MLLSRRITTLKLAGNFFCGKNSAFHNKNASNLAFIGVGQMGARMATNLIKKGEKNITIYDIQPANSATIEGAKICGSPEEASRDADIVITMLPDGQTVKQAFLGEKGILKSAPKNSLLIDCSTIEPQVAQELAQVSDKNGHRFLDAPVSGGVTGAEAATLTFMVGGEKTYLDEAEPILLKMGARVLHCGQNGAGQIAKLCNNLILGVTMIATAEGLNLGIKLGLDPKVLTQVVNVSSGRSWSSDTYNPVPGVMPNVPSSKNYQGGFVCRLVAKDLGLAENAARDCGAPVPLGAAAHQWYRTLIANGYGSRDFGIIYQFLRGGKD